MEQLYERTSNGIVTTVWDWHWPVIEIVTRWDVLWPVSIRKEVLTVKISKSETKYVKYEIYFDFFFFKSLYEFIEGFEHTNIINVSVCFPFR